MFQIGIPYTNYEVDACVRNLGWNPTNGRISFDLHWEEGKYVPVRDFGRNDRYANDEDRRGVLSYLNKYDGTNARARLILTVKGTSTDWTLASATMLRRLPIDEV